MRFTIPGIQQLINALANLANKMANSPAGQAFSNIWNRMSNAFSGGSNSIMGKWFRYLGSAFRFIQTGSAASMGNMFSLASGLGKFAFGLTIAVAAIGLFVKGLIAGVNHANEFTDNRSTALATPKEQGKIDYLADKLGVESSQMSKVVGSLPGQYKNLEGIIKYILNQPSEYAAQKVADQFGIPNISRLYGMNHQDVLEGLRNAGPSVSDDTTKRAADFDATINGWQRKIKAAIAEFFLGNKTDPHLGPVGNPDKKDKLADAADKLNNAADKLRDAADAFSWTNKEGVFGGMDTVRSRGAFPSNWAASWYQLKQQNINDTLYLGAFTL